MKFWVKTVTLNIIKFQKVKTVMIICKISRIGVWGGPGPKKTSVRVGRGSKSQLGSIRGPWVVKKRPKPKMGRGRLWMVPYIVNHLIRVGRS